MDLGNWLRDLSLERYEAKFRDHGIDEAILPHLTQDHLRELGFIKIFLSREKLRAGR
jgi:hypothetical protein